jgi:hypothetical protein
LKGNLRKLKETLMGKTEKAKANFEEAKANFEGKPEKAKANFERGGPEKAKAKL